MHEDNGIKILNNIHTYIYINDKLSSLIMITCLVVALSPNGKTTYCGMNFQYRMHLTNSSLFIYKIYFKLQHNLLLKVKIS